MSEVAVVWQLGERETVQLGKGTWGELHKLQCTMQFPGVFRPEEHDFADNVLKVEKGASGG